MLCNMYCACVCLALQLKKWSTILLDKRSGVAVTPAPHSHSIPHVQRIETEQWDAEQCRQRYGPDVHGEATVVVEGAVRVVQEGQQQQHQHGQDRQQTPRIHLLQSQNVLKIAPSHTASGVPRGGLGCSNSPPPKFRRYRWSPRSHKQEAPASRFPFVVHCVLIRL